MMMRRMTFCLIVTVLLLSVFVTVQAQPIPILIGEDFALPDFGLRIEEADAMFEEKQEYIDTLLLESEELEMLKEEDLLEDVAEKVASIEAKEAESIAKVEEWCEGHRRYHAYGDYKLCLLALFLFE